MAMCGNVQIRTIGGLVLLDQPMAMHVVLSWVDVFEEIGSCSLAAVVEGVGADVVVRQKLLLEVIRQLSEGRPSISELCVSACVWWRKLMRLQN